MRNVMGKINFHHRLGVMAAAFAALLLSVVFIEGKVSASTFADSQKGTEKYIKLDAKGAPYLVAAPTSAAQDSPVVVKVMVVSGNDIYVGGSFTTIGGIAANRIARYNMVSQRWFALGADLVANGNGVRGTTSETGVSTITVVGNDVYVGGLFEGVDNRTGQFVSANSVARWNTTTSTWSALGSGVGPQKNGFNGDVTSSVLRNGKLYFAGTFKQAFNSATVAVDVFQVATWDPATSTWSSLAKGLGAASPYEIYDMAVMGDNLYIGGNFPAVFRADNSVVHVACIARWNFTSNNWFAMGVESATADTNGTGGDVHALTTDGTTLFVGGFFPFAKNSLTDRPQASNIARWNGTTWSTLNGTTNVNNNGVDQVVTELNYSGGFLYVAGDFENVKNTNGSLTFASYLARWNGTAWTLFGAAAAVGGNGVNSEVHALAVADGQVYAGGIFTQAYNNIGNSVNVNGLARWTGSVWTAVTGSVAVKSLASVSAASYAVAAETTIDGIIAAFGTTLATGAQSSTTLPLPTNLLNTTVNVLDSAGSSRPAQLFFVSAGQINFLVPAGTAAGVATITVNSSDGSQSQGTITVTACAPGLFTANANGKGVPAAYILRVRANNTRVNEQLMQLDAVTSKWVPKPISLGPVGEKVFLIAFGTGIRGGTTPATMTMGGTAATVSFAGAHQSLVGVDQVNAEIPRSLIGRGEINVILTIGAKTANTVMINIQ